MTKANQSTKQQVIEAIEPHTLATPAMDRPSVAFAWFLDRMRIEDRPWVEGSRLILVCQVCHDEVCVIEDGDTLRVLLNTALAHGCA